MISTQLNTRARTMLGTLLFSFKYIVWENKISLFSREQLREVVVTLFLDDFISFDESLWDVCSKTIEIWSNCV